MKLKIDDLPYLLTKNYIVRFYDTIIFGIKSKATLQYLGKSENVIQGKGTEGVYKNYMVAIKRIPKTRFAPGTLDKVLEHVKRLKNLSHSNVIRIYDYFHSEDDIFIVMEYAEISNPDFYTGEQRQNYNEIVSGLNYLHSQGIDNRDITKDHVFMDSKRNIKIAEYGFTSFLGKYYIDQPFYLQNQISKMLKIYSFEGLLILNTDTTPAIGKPKKTKSSFLPSDLQKRYHYVRIVGSGAFGEVALAVDRDSKMKVAIKIIDKSTSEDIDREGIILKQLNHENIVKLFEVSNTKNKLYLVMEFAAKGSLEDYMEKTGKLKVSEAHHIFSQIVNGVDYLHSHNVVHYDLKPANVLRDSRGVIRVADFGLAKFFVDGKSVSMMGGTPAYAPPEAHFGHGKKKCNGAKFDVWSLGVIFYELLTNDLPEINQYVIMIPDYVYSGYADIIRNSLTFSPSDRPSAAKILVDLTMASFSRISMNDTKSIKPLANLAIKKQPRSLRISSDPPSRHAVTNHTSSRKIIRTDSSGSCSSTIAQLNGYSGRNT